MSFDDLSLDLPSPESLASRDQLICSSLEEKLQVFAALSALSGRTDGLPVGPQLLVQPQWEEPPPQAAALLAAAVKEGETFMHFLLLMLYHIINLQM